VHRAVALGLILVLSISVVSGPLVSAVDLTSSNRYIGGERGVPGTGNVTVASVTIPTEDVEFRRGKHDSGPYYLIAPDAVVDIESVEGHPVLNYKIRVPALGTTYLSTAFPREDAGGPTSLDIQKKKFSREDIEQSQYRVVFLIVARDSSGFRTVYESEINVSVDK